MSTDFKHPAELIKAINTVRVRGKLPDRVLIPDPNGRYILYRVGKKPTYNLNAKD